MKVKIRSRLGDQSGQGVLEYLLLLAIITSAFLLVQQGINRMGLMQKFMDPLQKTFAMTYKYGNSKTKGFDEGGPELHPRATSGGTNFRLFMSPNR